MGGRRVGRFAAAALISLSLSSPASAQDPVFRSQVNLVRLIVSVKDAQGGLVTDLSRDDFTVYDNGVKQTVSVFERDTDQPLSVSILIDASGSTWSVFSTEEQDVLSFVRAVLGEGNPRTAAALYAFNEEVTLLSSFTRNMTRLESGLHGLKAGGATSLYDAVWLVSRDFEGRDGRHIIVIISDGDDVGSVRDFHAAVEAAEFADATIYPVVIIPYTNPVLRNIGGEHALTTMAQRTGGRTFLPTTGAELQRAFVDLVHELRTQYLVGYYPKNIPPTDNRFHTTAVKLTRPGLRAIARTGYYGTADR
jgi:Ca-activated chloride channel family protein